MIADILKRIALSEVTLYLPARPFGKSNMKMNLSTE
jgi:hypothetical protein